MRRVVHNIGYRSLFKGAVLCALLFLAGNTSVSIVAAAEISSAADTVDVDVDTLIEPVQAIAFVMSNTGATQRLTKNWKKTADGVVTVKVPLASGDRASGTFVTAMVVGEDGNVAFGNTKIAFAPAYSSSVYSLPECPLRKAPRSLDNQSGLVESLTSNRADQRNVLQLKISELLQGDLLSKLSKLERGFGLERGRPLSASLPPLELEDRLSRIEQAIQNYRSKHVPAH